jgi:hypothetical protein
LAESLVRGHDSLIDNATPKESKMTKTTETAYIIRNAKTGQMIEAHDELSREWAESKVATHNALFPADQWVIAGEQL